MGSGHLASQGWMENSLVGEADGFERLRIESLEHGSVGLCCESLNAAMSVGTAVCCLGYSKLLDARHIWRQSNTDVTQTGCVATFLCAALCGGERRGLEAAHDLSEKALAGVSFLAKAEGVKSTILLRIFQ